MAHRYRLYPTEAQLPTLYMHVGHSRYVWNMALEQCLYARELGRYADQSAWNKQLAEARRFSWLKEGSSSVQQGALRDLRQAFRNWWGNPGHFSPPRWRSRHRGSQGFVVRDLTLVKVNRRWSELTVPKAGRVRFRLSRPVPHEATSARVTVDRSGRWHVSFVAPQPTFERTTTHKAVGLDMGIAATVTTSDGEHLRMGRLLSEGERVRRLKLQRKLARQQKGSCRRGRTKRSLAKLTAREGDRRNDWIEKATTRLVRDYDLIVIEDLKVKNMVRSAKGTFESPGRGVSQKTGLNREIHSQAWSTFRQRLIDKAGAATSMCTVISVDPRNTSRRCSSCSYTAKENRENQTVFLCQACGYSNNADINASINILAAGQAVCGRGGKVSLGSSSNPRETSTPVLRNPRP